jgi:hypothetical protein
MLGIASLDELEAAVKAGRLKSGLNAWRRRSAPCQCRYCSLCHDATVVVGALVDECLEALSKYKGSNSLDAALIARAQVIEHFEIACYGTLISWAELLGYDQAVALLEESLEEEESLDETLTEMAEGKSNLEADKEETKPRKTRAASRQ